MKLSGERAFELLKKIGFTRVAGSAEELQAAEILKAECEAEGVPAVIEAFQIEDAEIETATFEILEPYHQSYEVTGFKCAENTPDEGLTAEFVYVEDGLDANLMDVKGKIVLLNGMMRVAEFRRLLKAGVAGVVTMEGTIHDTPEDSDLSTRTLRRTLRAFGNLPAVNIRIKDAMEMVAKGACKAKLVLKNTTVERTSHDVVATILGTEKPEEIISFGAHFDSVPFSKGVFDNGAGSVTIMEMLRYFKANPPKRTVKFMWYGSEEIGLEGSWAYVKAHKDELKDHLLMINVDVGASILGADRMSVMAEEKLVSFTEYLMKIQGLPLTVRQSIYSSDSIPFADCGVPGVNFIRGGARGASYIHNRHDTLEFLSAEGLQKTIDVVLAFSEPVINSKVFPVERAIPKNIQEDVEKYLYKKELAEAENKA